MDLVTTPAAGQFGPPRTAEPSRIKLTGPLGSLKLPPVCASCGEGARATLRVEKRFCRTTRRGGSHYYFDSLDVPFCDGCRAAHAAELPPVDGAALGKLRWKFVVRILPYVIPIGVIVWMLPKVLVPAAAALTAPGGLAIRTDAGEWNWGLAIAVGIIAFFGYCLLAFLTLVSRARRDLLAADTSGADDPYVRRARLLGGDNAVFLVAPTSVLAAADFTDDRAELFEPERRTYTFRDPGFAERFRALNADRVWSARSPRARWARTARRSVVALVLGFGALSLLNEWTGGALWRVVGEFLP